VFGHPHLNFRINRPTFTEQANEGHHNDFLQSMKNLSRREKRQRR
jgi:hypothetical protein